MSLVLFSYFSIVWLLVDITYQGQFQDFKLGGGALKKIAPSEGRRENFGVFRVKNHDFTPKKIIFFPILRGAYFVLQLSRSTNFFF